MEEWDVLLFHNAEEMLECKKELQLLILDIEMPGLNGIELNVIVFYPFQCLHQLLNTFSGSFFISNAEVKFVL